MSAHYPLRINGCEPAVFSRLLQMSYTSNTNNYPGHGQRLQLKEDTRDNVFKDMSEYAKGHHCIHYCS